MKRSKILTAYFENSSRRTSSTSKVNNLLIDLLNKHGCNVIQTTMGTDISYTENVGDKASINIFESKRADARQADVLVFEVSEPSIHSWFLIFEAIQNRKPVLALYGKNTLSHSDVQFLKASFNFLFLKEYTESDLDDTVSKFLNKSKRKIPVSRFTLRLSEEMNDLVDKLKKEYDCSSKNDAIIRILEEKLESDRL